jgi:hypothetical protein
VDLFVIKRINAGICDLFLIFFVMPFDVNLLGVFGNGSEFISTSLKSRGRRKA